MSKDFFLYFFSLIGLTVVHFHFSWVLIIPSAVEA